MLFFGKMIVRISGSGEKDPACRFFHGPNHPGIILILTITAIRSKDIPQVMACVLLMAALFCLIMLLVDLLYAFLDPRIRARYTK